MNELNYKMGQTDKINLVASYCSSLFASGESGYQLAGDRMIDQPKTQIFYLMSFFNVMFSSFFSLKTAVPPLVQRKRDI